MPVHHQSCCPPASGSYSHGSLATGPPQKTRLTLDRPIICRTFPSLCLSIFPFAQKQLGQPAPNRVDQVNEAPIQSQIDTATLQAAKSAAQAKRLRELLSGTLVGDSMRGKLMVNNGFKFGLHLSRAIEQSREDHKVRNYCGCAYPFCCVK